MHEMPLNAITADEGDSDDVEKLLITSIWDRLLLGDTRSLPTQLPFATTTKLEQYDDYALVKSMLLYESIRIDALRLDGKAQHEYPNSNEGWLVTLFMIRGRALERIAMPWITVSLHAVIYTTIQEVLYGGSITKNKANVLQSWEVFFSFVVNTTLAFLLVHRLQRASDRYWTARSYWGGIIAKARTMVSELLVQGKGEHIDHAIRWIVAYVVAIMKLLRGRQLYEGNMLAGILVLSELQRLESNANPPIYAMTKIRL
jgi:hypothetical protein